MTKNLANQLTLLSVLLIIVVLLSNCRKDKFVTDASASLEFSTDSVYFDTVFTTVGSTTEILKIYNRSSDRIRISEISLDGGINSPYRINVDGVSGVNFTDIEIAGEDSMFIFIEVTLDPNDSSIPLVVEDRINFETNGNPQTVLLTAWGQDAYFHTNLNIADLQALPCDDTWFADKPHVIYGIVVVDSACTLTIEQGTQVYVHANSGLWVRKGTLDINGVLDNEVVFQGDRLESFFDDQPGQWGISVFGINLGGLWLTESKDSNIDYAILKNGVMGIQVDTLFEAGTPALTITNTIVNNMSGVGLLANSGAHVVGVNNLISNCGFSCGSFVNGGTYDMEYCTFANYWTSSNRQAPAFGMSNYFEGPGQTVIVRPIDSQFRNCIMYGNNATLNDFSEFIYDVADEENQSVEFTDCLFDSELEFDDNMNFVEIIQNLDPRFESPFDDDFHLKESSPAKDAGFSVSGVFLDLDGNPRVNGSPDFGCYEFQ